MAVGEGANKLNSQFIYYSQHSEASSGSKPKYISRACTELPHILSRKFVFLI